MASSELGYVHKDPTNEVTSQVQGSELGGNTVLPLAITNLKFEVFLKIDMPCASSSENRHLLELVCFLFISHPVNLSPWRAQSKHFTDNNGSPSASH